MTHVLRIAAVLLVCCAGAVTAGCSSAPAEPRDVPTPQQFLDREPLPSCGELELVSGEEIPAESFTCLDEAGKAGAELSVTRATTEGDPVTEYYRVLPAGGWEAYIDGSQDRNGGNWWYTDCPDAETIEDLANCKGVAL